MGEVGKKRGVPDEERIVPGAFDEIEDGLQALAPDGEPFVTVTTAAVGIAVRHARGEPAASVASFPPLAGLEADVASVGEKSG